MENTNLKLLTELVIDMKKDVADIKEKTILNTATLEDHTRRSIASEARLDVQEEKLEKFTTTIVSMHTIGKFLVNTLKILALIATIGLTILAWYYHSA